MLLISPPALVTWVLTGHHVYYRRLRYTNDYPSELAQQGRAAGAWPKLSAYTRRDRGSTPVDSGLALSALPLPVCFWPWPLLTGGRVLAQPPRHFQSMWAVAKVCSVQLHRLGLRLKSLSRES